jgi:hypothetical protein
MAETCRSCGQPFEDWHKLALHIASSKKGHRQGKKWAAMFLAGKSLRPELKRVPLNPDEEHTDFGDNNRENAKREISGDNEYINTLCPQCKKPHRQLIPVEHIHNELAWRKDSVLCVICDVCRR